MPTAITHSELATASVSKLDFGNGLHGAGIHVRQWRQAAFARSATIHAFAPFSRKKIAAIPAK
jgi:hypothetical protein